jgi:CDP-glucose 4,6-dehydratase
LWGIEPTVKIENNFDNLLRETNYLMLEWGKAKSKLGWNPVWNVDTALFNTINWYKKYYDGEKNIIEICKINIEQYNEDASRTNVNALL